jgi:hypothetical protein
MKLWHLVIVRRWFVIGVVAGRCVVPPPVGAQDADPRPATIDTTVATAHTTDTTYSFATTVAGEFTPGYGFDLVKTPKGSLNISLYGLFRYVNQTPGNQQFVDHLGRERTVNTVNSLNWHRTQIWLSGFFWTQRLRYTITAWSLPTTQQALVFGLLQYYQSKYFQFGAGILPTLTARSMQGSWPYWGGSDRQMGEEFFRGGFSSGVFVAGEPLYRFTYTLSINNNLSQLGVVQANDTRDLAYSASFKWQPTTGEFGPRGGFNDLEYHTTPATRFGGGVAKSRESRYAQIGDPPNATQIKLSDGVNPFDEGALVEGVTVQSLVYKVLFGDIGYKYRGFTAQGEWWYRKLDDLTANGPLPETSINDRGGQLSTSYMVVPRQLAAYVSGSYIWDQFRRFPWEAGGGLTYYPSGTRSWRLNAHLMHVNKSPAASSFGYYVAGMTGTIFSLGTDVLF